jgi:hypothetical protein
MANLPVKNHLTKFFIISFILLPTVFMFGQQLYIWTQNSKSKKE